MNIAEGAGCCTNREFGRFLETALRSGYEIMTVIDIARGLDYLPDATADSLMTEANEIVAMIAGLLKSPGWPFHDR